MNGKSKSCSTGCCRRAFTLVEVVASLMLLGTLLVAILVAHRRHVEQIRHAEARLAATEAADGLLAKWSAEGTWGATKNAGEFEGRPGLAWQWTVIPAQGLNRLGAAVGRLEVVGRDGIVLSHVDVLTADVLSN
jgi:prepilin-type N-terminal cleavage/methylation domain-containing protein